jgi:hypothetical protein
LKDGLNGICNGGEETKNEQKAFAASPISIIDWIGSTGGRIQLDGHSGNAGMRAVGSRCGKALQLDRYVIMFVEMFPFIASAMAMICFASGAENNAK